jgi:multidrug efflux pump subunit AcrA (membrane-fusion protein)
MSATAQIMCYQKNAALVVPVKALHATDDGSWELEIEQAEGKTSRVAVKRGRTSGDKVEILSGLAKDQVVITPGA